MDIPFWVVIPARYASSRLPGKPLCDIAGLPMIQHVYAKACASGASKVIIATDDKRIVATAEQFGATVCLTSPEHRSGTDRVAEAAQLYAAPAEMIIVNVQGDEPLIPPALIGQVAVALARTNDADMATLCEPIQTATALFNPNVVKVVCDAQGFALYFSRAPIPWQQGEFKATAPADYLLRPQLHYRHLGIYAYRTHYLQHCTQLSPIALEQAESLEQLRVLFNGGRIYVEVANQPTGIGVDTPEDLAVVRNILANGEK